MAEVGLEQRMIDNAKLDRPRIEAGFEYSNALLRLGLDPDFIGWVYLGNDDRLELVIVDSIIDRVGPSVVYEILFKAFDAAATPTEINPFEVGLYSPDTDLGIDLIENVAASITSLPKDENRSETVTSTMWRVGIHTPKAISGWGVYVVKSSDRSAIDDLKLWKRFVRNVDALAA